MCVQVSSHAIDEIGQLYHVEDENLVKWSSTSSGNEWNLVTFTDRHNANRFIRIVESVSRISLQIVRTQTNKTVQYASVETKLILSEEEKVPLSSQAPATVESFTTPPLGKSAFEDNSFGETVEPKTRDYITEAVDSDVDDTYSHIVGPKFATDDFDDDVIPLSPAHTIDDDRLIRSTPKNKVSKSAFVPGIEFNVKEKKLPRKLPSFVDVQVNNIMCILCTYMCVYVL